MSQPSTRQELIDYSLRRLGYPVLEINVDDDQIEDLVDDAIQHFQDYHYDGVERMYLKHKVTKAEKETLRTGVTTTTATSSTGVTSVGWAESLNFLQLPDHVQGLERRGLRAPGQRPVAARARGFKAGRHRGRRLSVRAATGQGLRDRRVVHRVYRGAAACFITSRRAREFFEDGAPRRRVASDGRRS